MKVKDIQWNSTIVEFTYIDEDVKNIPIESEIELDYDQDCNKYFVRSSFGVFYVSPCGNAKGVLDALVKGNDKRNRICWVLDVSDKTIIVKICPFRSSYFLNEFQELNIEISNDVVQSVKKTSAMEAIPILEKEFMFKNSSGENVIFIIGISEYDSNKNDKAFTIISRNRRLTVSRINGKLVATRNTRMQGDVYYPISAYYGNISFVSSGEATAISEACSKQLEKTLSSDGYLAMWDAYNDLERLLKMHEAKEKGFVEYSNVEVEVRENIIYKFKVSKYNFYNVNEDMEIDATTDDAITKDDVDGVLEGTLQSEIESRYVGEFLKYENGIAYVVNKKYDTPDKHIPPKGFLFKSVQGDARMLERRDNAKKDISCGVTPMPGLGMLIDSGKSILEHSKNYTVITSELKRKLSKARGEEISFNEQQDHAIKIALNTPDIALIQGPPGTGKTTVIKAIIARFEEIYKKENDGDFPRILVTSFQHEAVNNAIKGINYSGLPANRFGGKRGEKNPQKEVISKWIKDSCETIDKYADNHSVPMVHNAIETLKNKVFVWKSTGQDIDKGIDILQEELSKARLEFSKSLNDRIQHLDVLRNSDAQNNKISRIPTKEEDFLNSLKSLRLTQNAFSDDGLENLEDFKTDAELGFFKDVCPDLIIPQFVEDVISSKGSDQSAFEKYVNYVKDLIDKYTPTIAEEGNEEVDLLEELEDCLSELIVETKSYLLNKIENIEEAKCEILLQYKDELLAGNARQIIRDYADVFASTCQQSVPYKNDTPDEYDLVIVDEAARANPLDLFIPMAMAKKIVLVGDQRQLPHMIEPSIRKRIAEESEEKLKLYEESFFEYLFNLLKQKGDELSPFAKACTLTQQYRMLPEISDFVSETIYEGKLKCGLSEEKKEERRIIVPEYKGKSVVWVNVDVEKGEEQDGISKSREAEVKVLLGEIKRVLSASDKIKSIGIITFYKKQKEEIEKELESNLSKADREKIETGTVDAFQGKEYDVVFLSCVRSNLLPENDLKKKVGFLLDNNRLCVALSRSKNLLVCVGDEETVSHVEILKNFIEYCKNEEKGCYIGNC